MAEFCAKCMKKNDFEIVQGKQLILSKDLDLCEGCGQMKQVVIEIKDPNKELTLIERLEKARVQIEKAYEEEDSGLMGSLAKRIQDLYFQCYNLDDDSKERHYAEYLKLMVMLHFEFLYDAGGDTEGTYEACQYEAYMAGFGKNRLTGEYRE